MLYIVDMQVLTNNCSDFAANVSMNTIFWTTSWTCAESFGRGGAGPKGIFYELSQEELCTQPGRLNIDSEDQRTMRAPALRSAGYGYSLAGYAASLAADTFFTQTPALDKKLKL